MTIMVSPYLREELITEFIYGDDEGYQEIDAHQNDDSRCYSKVRAATFLEGRYIPDTQQTQEAVIRPFSLATVGNVAILDPNIVLPKNMPIQPDDYSDEEPLSFRPDVAFEDDKILLYSEVYRVYRECSAQDWDGYEGIPISDETFLEAIEIIRLLPKELPLPEVMPEPTGEIAFEWYKDRKHVFVISVGGKERLSYAGLFGTGSETHGFESFSDRFPQSFVSHIKRLFD
jgi:hypothetical protein